MSFSRKNLKNLSSSNLSHADGLASQSQATQQLQFPTKSQSHSHSPQERQQSQLIYPWSAHAPLGQSPSPFPRYGHALSTTATAAGELFLFGGYANNSTQNDLYVFSTRDFSTTLLHTSGGHPIPRAGHGAALTSTVLVIWGGATSFVSQNVLNRDLDDSFYLLNLGTSDLLVSRLTPVDQRLRSSITRVDPCLGQRSRARRSLLPYNDVGRFQALRLWRRGHQEAFQ